MTWRTGSRKLGGIVAMGVGLTLAASAAKGAASDEMWAAIQHGMDAFTNHDRAAFATVLTDDLTAYDVDPEGKPVKIASKAEALAYLDANWAAAKEMGATMGVTMGDHACTAAGELGYCIAEVTFSMKPADGEATLMPSRITFVLRKTVTGWKCAHWHGSPAVAPAMP